MSTSIAEIHDPGTASVREVSDALVPGHDRRSAGDLEIRGGVDRAYVHAGGALVVDGRAGGATLACGGDMTLAWAHSCAIAAGGALTLLGPGATDCDIEVGSDMVARAPEGAIRSGLLRVGGRLDAHELAGREGARLRVVMEAGDARGDLVRVDVIQPGVEIVACGELLRFDRRHERVVISVAGGRAVLTSS